MSKLAEYRKSILSGAIAALSFAIPVVDDGVKPSEGLGIALAFLVGLGIVAVVPNRKPALGE